jgi:hypothetical protein
MPIIKIMTDLNNKLFGSGEKIKKINFILQFLLTEDKK